MTASERIRKARERQVNLSERSAAALQLNLNDARAIGARLADVFPDPGSREYPTVPAEYVADIADQITAVVAEILQAWLNAGSERDVTYEELGPAIEAHVKGWSA